MTLVNGITVGLILCHMQDSSQETSLILNAFTKSLQKLYCFISSSTFPPPMANDNSPFKLYFVSGNISKCAGCGNMYAKPPMPPYESIYVCNIVNGDHLC